MASRISARTAKHPTDQDLHLHLVHVRRGLEQAVSSCEQVIHSKDPNLEQMKRVARKNLNTLLNMLSLLDSVGLMGEGDVGDYDMLPETTKADLARERNSSRRAQKSAAHKVLSSLHLGDE